MNNIIDFIQEKLKINSNTKINQTGTFNKIPKREYNLIDLAKSMYNKQEKLGCYACFGYTFYDKYIKKYFNNNTGLRFYIINIDTLDNYNKKLDDKLEKDSNLSIINIKGFERIFNIKKSEHTIRVFKDDNDNQILYIESCHNNSYLKIFIIEKETFTRI